MSYPSSTGFDSQPSGKTKGFFAGLFDVNFTEFVTLKVLKVLYIINLVLIGITVLTMMVSSLATLFRGYPAGLVGFILAPVAGFVAICLVRLSFELVAVLFRIGQNTTILAEETGAPASLDVEPPSDYYGGSNLDGAPEPTQWDPSAGPYSQGAPTQPEV